MGGVIPYEFNPAMKTEIRIEARKRNMAITASQRVKEHSRVDSDYHT
jgi:hypothetical protein